MTGRYLVIAIVLLQGSLTVEAVNIGKCVDILIGMSTTGTEQCTALTEFIKCLIQELELLPPSASQGDLIHLENIVKESLFGFGINCRVDLRVILQKIRAEEERGITFPTRQPTGFDDAETKGDCVNAMYGSNMAVGGIDCALITPFVKCLIRVTEYYKEPHTLMGHESFISEVQDHLHVHEIPCIVDVIELSDEVAIAIETSSSAPTRTAKSTTPETISTTPETISTTPETISTTPETTSTTPETISTTPQTISTTPQTISTTPETISTTPETTSTTPQTISTTPQTISTTPETISTTPEIISTTPETISTTPKTLSTTPKDLSSTPKDLFTTPKDSSDSPKDLSTTPKDLSTTPKDLSTTPKDLSTTPKDSSDSPKDLSTTPKDLSTTPKDLSATPQTTPTPPTLMPKANATRLYAGAL
ncbi:hypothetical protein BsWGS_09428 [Bradybaena similaris]